MPGDPIFNQFDNKYDAPSYKKICTGFGIAPSGVERQTTDWEACTSMPPALDRIKLLMITRVLVNFLMKAVPETRVT